MFLELALLLAAQWPAHPPLTPDGWGPIRIGMSEAQAIEAGKLQPPDDGPPLEGHFDCHDLLSETPNVWVMIREGNVARVSVYGEGEVVTDRGFGVGAREADILAAYGQDVEVREHAYDGEPAHYLTIWTDPQVRGVRYETDTVGKVTAIHVGDESIQLIEGCA
jgi:hypothetical protein